MSKLFDFLTFKPATPEPLDPSSNEPLRPRKAERDTAILEGKAPPSAAEIESVSEYRLASLLQYPHH